MTAGADEGGPRSLETWPGFRKDRKVSRVHSPAGPLGTDVGTCGWRGVGGVRVPLLERKPEPTPVATGTSVGTAGSILSVANGTGRWDSQMRSGPAERREPQMGTRAGVGGRQPSGCHPVDCAGNRCRRRLTSGLSPSEHELQPHRPAVRGPGRPESHREGRALTRQRLPAFQDLHQLPEGGVSLLQLRAAPPTPSLCAKQPPRTPRSGRRNSARLTPFRVPSRRRWDTSPKS